MTRPPVSEALAAELAMLEEMLSPEPPDHGTPGTPESEGGIG